MNNVLNTFHLIVSLEGGGRRKGGKGKADGTPLCGGRRGGAPMEEALDVANRPGLLIGSPPLEQKTFPGYARVKRGEEREESAVTQT